MSTLAVPYFHSATVVSQYPATAAVPEESSWRGILAVEPDITVLHARSLLLAKANYCVTRVTGDREIFNLRGTKGDPLAILSDHLGQRLLGTVAETVRRQWPRTRILILGQVPMGLEDYLYDEQIVRSSDPQQVLADLEALYKGMWKQRFNTLEWNATRSARCFVRPPTSESDPTKIVPRASTQIRTFRDTPSNIRVSVTSHN